ncbi:hypothetical protein AX14_010770 [Amanita brunnescens Koide BX004]|nr:hypothetical protein AX14_010770 [Amanita brunnescens Koide BX004]
MMKLHYTPQAESDFRKPISITASDYKLQKFDDTLNTLTNPPVERSFPGNIAAGSYLILPSAEVSKIAFKILFSLLFYSKWTMEQGSMGRQPKLHDETRS